MLTALRNDLRMLCVRATSTLWWHSPRRSKTLSSSRPTLELPSVTSGEATILGVILIIMFGLVVYSCGPEALCIAQGGDPAVNAFGMEWCELDGNNRPSDGDYRLGW